MKKLTWIIVILAMLVFWCISQYNGLVKLQEDATKAAANVQSTYQRRADLIPNLVEVVKGYAAHEKETFEAVINARSKATQMNIDPSNCTPEQLKKFQEAQGELGSALGRLIAISENYPDLKANENFKNLQVQLEGTENRINEARDMFNEAVTDYNKKRRSFPVVLVSGMLGFDNMAKFEADASAQSAPQVKF